MFMSVFVSGIESALMAIEAGNVIALRLQMMVKGDAAAQLETELMISEKMEAFTQAARDMATGAPSAVIQNNFRTLIRANEARLSALR